ncbi:outer membrane beta-barrel protein [Mesoterricola silvestris]|uniref:Outer membrane protein beta-barrel domain-containing protein n=1 Tax=Mesoterricola silvestris TaxID=2927979 RepID=A0AA48GW76_9BACT|nr:outer membrane beta-barrel protein [Mesoterricola silvestris]BDU72976.1 hypothetical protein METEAL_21500 [Mesoterricola silvestris]
MSPSTRMLLIAPLLAAAPLAAAEAGFGAQLHLAKPLGTFSDARHLDNTLGWGLGLMVPVDFGAGQGLRPKLDYLSFRRGAGDQRYKADALLLMADYTCFVADEAEGGYVFAGLGLHSTRLDATRGIGPLVTGARHTHTGFAFNVGLGYAFTRNFTFEVKYLGMDMGRLAYTLPATTDPSFMANAIVGSLGYKF